MLFFISAAEFKQIPEFSNYSIEELLEHDMDDSILSFFEKYGVDKTKGVYIQACKHRNSAKEIVVDYRWTMIERKDEEWKRDTRSSLEARVHGNSHMTRELNRMGNALGVEGGEVDKWSVLELVHCEEDEQATILRMLELQEKQIKIRGYLREGEDMLSVYKTRKELKANDKKYVEKQGWVLDLDQETD